MPPTTNAVASSSTHAASPEASSSAAADAAETVRKTRRRDLDVDASLILSEGRSKRRRTPTPPPKAEKDIEREEGPKDRTRACKLGMEMYMRVLNEKDTDGTVMSKPFMKLPSQKTYADYYEFIKQPMALEIIHNKLKTEQYETLEAVRNEFGLIFNNAKRYNTKESLLFLYAKKLHKLTRTLYEELSSSGTARTSSAGPREKSVAAEESDSEQEGEPVSTYSVQTPAAGGDDEDEGDNPPFNVSPGQLDKKGQGRKRGSYFKNGPTVYKLLKPILKSLISLHSTHHPDHKLSDMFMTLPSREDFPDYYKVIIKPISFEQIEKKLQARQYLNYSEFFIDVTLMCDNAMYYNEEGSAVYQDAEEIKSRLVGFKAEIEQRLANPGAMKPIRIRVPPAQPIAVVAPPTASSTPYQPQVIAPQPQPQPQPQPASSAPLGLPRGVVNAEIVSRLKQFPQAEQLAWAASLNGQQQTTLQALMAQARAPVPAPAPMPTPAPLSVPVPAQAKQALPTPTPTPALVRPVRAEPLVGHVIFAFRSKPAVRMVSTRLANLRGLANHAVTVGPQTDVVDVTAMAASLESLVTKANGSAIVSSPAAPDAGEAAQHWSIPFPLHLAHLVIEISSASHGSGGSSELAPTSIFVSRQL